jgi:hypothetical protein
MEVRGQLHEAGALLPVKEPPVPIWQEVGWALKPVYRGGEEKHPCHCPESNPDRTVRSSVTIPTELPRLLALY